MILFVDAVSVFSGLNNLRDISLAPAYATLCGYTQNDLETVFVDHLAGADMEMVREWYNGYNFCGESVYNPFDILLFIKNGLIFKSYWFATGTPTFLIKLIQKQNYFIPKLNDLRISEILIDSDIETLELEPILFQTGYLSIKSVEDVGFGQEYGLGFPNKEVAISFNDVIIRYLTNESNVLPFKKSLLACLKEGDLRNLRKTSQSSLCLHSLHNDYVNNTISSYEGYYASVICAYFASLGLNMIPEDVTNKGRIDLTIKVNENIYIIEFKVDGDGQALAQVKAKGYHEKFLGSGKTIYLVGIDFNAKDKNLSGFAWERFAK